MIDNIHTLKQPFPLRNKNQKRVTVNYIRNSCLFKDKIGRRSALSQIIHSKESKKMVRKLDQELSRRLSQKKSQQQTPKALQTPERRPTVSKNLQKLLSSFA